VALEVEEI